MPWALYLPLGARYRVEGDAEVAVCGARCERRREPVLVRPEDVEIEVRGAGNATRQINHIVKPEFPAERLLVVEVFTPSGNWSSYPPHKHDVHNPPGEVDLEEIYYYRVDRPEGYAIQKIYTADRRIDQTLSVRDGELVLLILRPSLWFIAIQSALFIGVVALLAALLARADRHLNTDHYYYGAAILCITARIML